MNGFKPVVRTAGTLFAAACLATAYGSVARPGTVNYAEGQVHLNGRTIGAKALGNTEVDPGQVLQTANGKAEILLTPGVYLRIGENSAVKMVSPSITNTQVQLLRGEANLEVDLLAKENHLSILDNGADVQIQKKGIYSLSTDPPQVAVYDGKAEVQAGDRSVDVKKGRELTLRPNARLKPQKFDRDRQDALYAWSKLRSQYEADANASSAQMVLVNNYPGWWGGTGWYWNPYFDSWAFVPGGGYFDNPWGFGFYSPAYFGYYGLPYYGGGFYRGGRILRPGRTFAGGRTAVRPAPSFRAPALGGMHAPMMGGGHFGGGHFGGGRR
jgi:hypothetical protein